jgi:hypothetical protein
VNHEPTSLKTIKEFQLLIKLWKELDKWKAKTVLSFAFYFQAIFSV